MEHSEEGTQRERNVWRCLNPMLLAWVIKLLNNLQGEGKKKAPTSQCEFIPTGSATKAKK